MKYAPSPTPLDFATARARAISAAVTRRWDAGTTPAFLAAFRRGAVAAFAGGECPYRDLRTGANKVTWSRAFRREWHEGRRQAVEALKEEEP